MSIIALERTGHTTGFLYVRVSVRYGPPLSFGVREPRVGIAREYGSHRVSEGMLYSIVQLRFRRGVKIGIRVNEMKGITLPGAFPTKFGGEGRVCHVRIKLFQERSLPYFKKDDLKIRMVLLDPADFGGRWHPPGFKEDSQYGDKYLSGTINDLKLRLVSACVGRPLRIGGWDLARKRVKSMKSYVPAGSVYFFETDGDPTTLRTEGKIGRNTAIGLGHYLLGMW